jgi:hypothetical protein
MGFTDMIGSRSKNFDPGHNQRAALEKTIQDKRNKYNRLEKERGSIAAVLEEISDIHREGAVPIR